MSTFFLEGVRARDDKAGDTLADFLHPNGEAPARPGRPQRNVTLCDLNVEQNLALWRTVLTEHCPDGDPGVSISRSPRASGVSRDISGNLAGSVHKSGLHNPSGDLRSLTGMHRLPAPSSSMLFGADGAHAAAETARRRGYIDRAFEVSKKGGGSGRRVGAAPPHTMHLSSRPAAASKKLDEAIDGATGVKG